MSDLAQLQARARHLDASRAGVGAALDAEAAPVDASVLALAVAIVRGKRRTAQLATDAEARALARAVLTMAQALASARMTDRTPDYAPGEPDRAGHAPPAGDAWLTPREVAEGALPFLKSEPIKEPRNGS